MTKTNSYVDDTKMQLIDLNALNRFPIRLSNYDSENGNENFVLGIECVLEYANNLHVIDAEIQRQGQWVPWAGNLMKCTYCGHEYVDYVECKNFCGNCGAKMSVEVDKE